MRWPIKPKKHWYKPEHGAIRYRLRFAWRPVIVERVNGQDGWDRQIIWLERVIEQQEYFLSINPLPGWRHDSWMPVTEFTMSLYRHNNQ